MLYVIWMIGAVLTAAESKLPFGRLVVVGLAAVVFAQMLVNVGMAVGLLPIIGVSLPYISAGGTNLLAAWIMTGLIVGVAMRRPVPPIRPSFEYDD
jgi:rod shape determining protein RodA